MLYKPNSNIYYRIGISMKVLKIPHDISSAIETQSDRDGYPLYISPIIIWVCPRGVMVKAMNCGIVVREFVLQSRYYVHFRANTLGKGMNPLILPPAMGK